MNQSYLKPPRAMGSPKRDQNGQLHADCTNLNKAHPK